MTAQRHRSAAFDRRHDLELAEAHMAGIGGTPSRPAMAEKVERACYLAGGADGDAGVERRRVEFLMSQRTRAIMRTFYVIEIESSAERNRMLASGAALSKLAIRG